MDHPISSRTRIDLFLSGGGYRAALGALGVLFYLGHSKKWNDVGRIVSVSGGSLLNALLAIERPGNAELSVFIQNTFDLLTSKRTSATAIISSAILTTLALLSVVGISLKHLTFPFSAMTTMLALFVALHYGIRLWLYFLYSGVLGSHRLSCLSKADWQKEHVFVSTDLSEHGSMFFVANPLNAQVCSSNRGFFEAGNVTLRKAVRASTALPPVLPPTRLRIRKPKAKTGPSIWAPRHTSQRLKVWLADGGVTGNLGVQLDPDLSPDNVTLLMAALQQTLVVNELRGPPLEKYSCTYHPDEIVWTCSECDTRRVVVDASGMTPRKSRLIETLLRIPVLAQPIFAARSLHVMYESSLADDQSNAGDDLVGVVRTEQIVRRLAQKNRPPVGRGNMRERMRSAQEYEDLCASLRNSEEQTIAGMTRLVKACYQARSATALIPTTLSAIPKHHAALAVASGYLNAFLNDRGESEFDEAVVGLALLNQTLGNEMSAWWRSATIRAGIDSPGLL